MSMNWKVEYLTEAKQDLERLDHSQQILVLKGIHKVSANPLPQAEGGYGKPLGNHSDTKLAGLMKIIVISVRADLEVYKIAARRVSR